MSPGKSANGQRTAYLALVLLTIVAGVVLRRLPMGLPFFLVKYGGSVLWAAMIYWLVAALRPAWRVAEVAFVAAICAALVEFFKLYHAPALDGFRRTVAGSLLLGRYFSLWDIAAYWAGIAAVAWLDGHLLRRRSN
jgi:hypothetical protein